jgi:nucleotide-binding universal stress UspA family protein
VRDRLLGAEHTLRLARMTKTPMYAVAPDRGSPPGRIVVAMDFSATSLRAARLALTVAAPDAEILLAHVTTPAGRAAPVGAMRRLVDGLQTGFCGRVTAVDLVGDAGTEILGLAIAQNADAIALGTQGTAPKRNGVAGPVATRVIRCSSCSLLIAPAVD